jgi:hypothetical protein
LRLEEFKDLQVVTVNFLMQDALKLETVPLYVDSLGNTLISVQEISRTLTNMVRLGPVLIGRNNNEASSTMKWLELEFDLE